MENGTISRERLAAPPGAVYSETALKPSYDFMLEHYFDALIETNKAWTVMLIETGIVDRDAGSRLLEAIVSLEPEGREAMGAFHPGNEYFYSTMERCLIEKTGEAIAGEINIGRTRPEPLARMVVRERLLDLLNEQARLRARLLEISEKEAATVMPIGTHMQQAQVSTFGHYLMGLVNAMERDFERLFAAYGRVNRCTLGCGALAGTSYPVDRRLVAELLGFDGFIENTNDCVASGDYMLETSAAIANMMITLSRLCQDLHIWHTQEFDYLTIGDEYSGSSSLMPQKKNPYPFEYIRIAAAHTAGEMTSVFATLHNTNFQDIKDVEEGLAPPVFRALGQASQSLRLLEGALSTLKLNDARMRQDAEAHFATCTELAATIHRNTDLSYRTAHRIVGNLVRRALDEGRKATEVDAALLRESANQVIGRSLDIGDETVRQALAPETFVEVHAVPGGPNLAALQAAIKNSRACLEADTRRITQAREALSTAQARLDELVSELVGPTGNASL